MEDRNHKSLYQRWSSRDQIYLPAWNNKKTKYVIQQFSRHWAAGMKHSNSWEKGNNEVSPVIFQLTLLPQRDSRLWWGQGGPKRSLPGTLSWGDRAESPEIKVREVYRVGRRELHRVRTWRAAAYPRQVFSTVQISACIWGNCLKLGENTSKRIKGNNGLCSHRTGSSAVANSQNGKTCNSQSIG